MDDVQVIRFLSRSLEQAASQQDWPKMQTVDARIADLLRALQGQPLTDDKRDALGELQRVHQQVSHYCQQRSDELQDKMAHARRNQEGAAAYAQFADAEDAGR